MLRIIFGPGKNTVGRGWRKFHNEEFNKWYSSSEIIRVIKSKRIRWAGPVAHIAVEKCIGYEILVANSERETLWKT
jgi:hypothetical protein